MAKQKYYAVRIGRVPGIYSTWNQAEEQVKGFSGAIYKSFDTMEEADKFMLLSPEISAQNLDESIVDANKEISQKIDSMEENEVIAFVDGSYSEDAAGKEKYSFGVVLITREGIFNLFKAFVSGEGMTSRNVVGEIEGAKQAILWAIENKKVKVTIYYDYEGIEKWANKEWTARKKLTQAYSEFYDEKSKLIQIEFKHVKAHSGIVYNEKADELAKGALLAQGYKSYNDGSIYFIGYDIENWKNIIKNIDIENLELAAGTKIINIITQPFPYLDRMNIKYGNDNLTINCYKGKKSYVQGKQSVLFQKCISYAIDNLPSACSVVEKLNSYHALTLTKDEVQEEFLKLLPDFPDPFKDTKHYNNLLSAVYNTMLVGYMPDYTCLLTPIFRTTEYYLHRVLNGKLGLATETSSGKNNFAFFSKDPVSLRYYYNSGSSGLTQQQIDFLNDLYNYYNRIRHPYSHWSQNSMDTQVISQMNVARDLIKEGLIFVNDYYLKYK